jgi:hypothetical protein
MTGCAYAEWCWRCPMRVGYSIGLCFVARIAAVGTGQRVSATVNIKGTTLLALRVCVMCARALDRPLYNSVLAAIDSSSKTTLVGNPRGNACVQRAVMQRWLHECACVQPDTAGSRCVQTGNNTNLLQIIDRANLLVATCRLFILLACLQQPAD